jgi:hypothetical protein
MNSLNKTSQSQTQLHEQFFSRQALAKKRLNNKTIVINGNETTKAIKSNNDVNFVQVNRRLVSNSPQLENRKKK